MSEPQRQTTRITAPTDIERAVLPPGAARDLESTPTWVGGALVRGTLREDLRPQDAVAGAGQGVGSPTVTLYEIAADEDDVVDDLSCYGTVEVSGE